MGNLCAFRGPHLRTIECKPCQAAGGRLDVFSCGLFGECSLNSSVRVFDGAACSLCELGVAPRGIDVVPPFSSRPLSAVTMAGRPLLTIGMATYQDYRATWFTIQAIRMALAKEIADGKVELVIINNDPEHVEGKELATFCEEARIRHVPYTGSVGTAHPRSHLWEVANGKWVLCCDAHVLFPDGALRDFLQWLERNQDRQAFVSGPLLTSGQMQIMATHLESTWSVGPNMTSFGKWKVDREWWYGRDPELRVQFHGLGLWAAPRDSWPGFHPKHYGFGGIEGYIQERWRRFTGGETITLRCLKWVHLFGRKHGVKFPWTGPESQVHNYLYSWTELGAGIGRPASICGLDTSIDDIFDSFGGRDACLAWPMVKVACKELSL